MEQNDRSENKADFNALYLVTVKPQAVTRTGRSFGPFEWRPTIQLLLCLFWHWDLISVVRRLRLGEQVRESQVERADKPDSELLCAAGQAAQTSGLLSVSRAGLWLAGVSWEGKECRLAVLQYKHSRRCLTYVSALCNGHCCSIFVFSHWIISSVSYVLQCLMRMHVVLRILWNGMHEQIIASSIHTFLPSILGGQQWSILRMQWSRGKSLKGNKKPPGISDTVKGQLTEAPGYHGRNSACAVVHVSSSK